MERWWNRQDHCQNNPGSRLDAPPYIFSSLSKSCGTHAFWEYRVSFKGEVHSEVTSLFSVAHESPLSLEEPVEVLRPRVRVVPQEQLQDEGPHDGSGVDAVAGERADPFRPATVVVLGQFLGWEDKRT